MKTAILQTALSAVISLSFALLFNVRGRKLVVAAVGAPIAWMVYLLVSGWSGSPFAGLFAATALTALASEVLARRMAAPVIVFLVPILIPLFPGGDLYYAAASLVASDGKFAADCLLVLQEAGSIAGGIVAVACLVQAYYHIRRARRKVRK